MKIYLARHGQSNYNVERLLNADPSVDVHLTDKGIDQSEDLALKLKSTKFEVIYISELRRTKQTAEIVNRYHKVPLIVDGRLNDNASGFEGKPVREYMEAFRASNDSWREAFNDGESLEHTRNRVDSFLKDLKNTSYACVLIVTHDYVIECINGILNGLSFEESSKFNIAQGDYTVFEY